MKTEQQLLLTYMYQEGYIEEDMYDERVVQKAFRSIDFLVFKAKIAAKKVVIAFTAAFKKIVEVVKSIWAAVSESPDVFEEYIKILEQENKIDFSIPPIDFKKWPIIRHQVLNRKLKHMNRKIIC